MPYQSKPSVKGIYRIKVSGNVDLFVESTPSASDAGLKLAPLSPSSNKQKVAKNARTESLMLMHLFVVDHHSIAHRAQLIYNR